MVVSMTTKGQDVVTTHGGFLLEVYLKEGAYLTTGEGLELREGAGM